MHILHVIDNMFLDRGGPVAVVTGLSGAQSAAGDRVTILCRARLRAGERHSDGHSLAAGVELVESGDVGAKDAGAILRRLAPDVVHFHGVWELYLRRFAVGTRAIGIPWVLSTHGMLHPVPMAKGWLKKRVYLRLLGDAACGARTLFVTSREEQPFASGLIGVPAEVLFNGVEFVAAERAAVRPLQGAMSCVASRPYLLFLGRIHPIKGIDRLVRSFAIARRGGLGADLVLAGPLDGHESAVAEVARNLGVSDAVHFVGPLFGSAKFEALAGCALFVHRPRYEGFGMTVIEAMAAGRPALTTVACGVARECPPGVLEISPDSDEAFGAAILRLCSTDGASEAEALAARGRDWVRSVLSWDAIARQARVHYR